MYGCGELLDEGRGETEGRGKGAGKEGIGGVEKTAGRRGGSADSHGCGWEVQVPPWLEKGQELRK